MRRFTRASAALVTFAALTLATPAFALNEPNGTVIPRDSMNGEAQLYTLFQSIGEPIDWLADAGTSPSTFSPLCGFSAKYVLNEAGSKFGLAWYNATGAPPQQADLHLIMPPGSAVGTQINSADIKNDPAYLGGAIGFALIGGQTHYSEPQWNPVCSGCNPASPWISTVVYASKNVANGFYLAFEDGSFGADPNGFNNDGDFNDDVFLVWGVTCLGGGQPCDTGVPGICGPGLTQCTPNGVTCKQSTPPSPTETCNGLDDDCNGVTDEGDICPAGFICDKGACVEECGTGEFNCPEGLVCANGYCVDPACKDVTCPSGQVCVQGICKAPCDGVVCPYPQVCRVGACVDPCAGVACDQGQVCDQGVCVAKCDCAPCAAGKACDAASGVCAEPACVGVSCPSGQHCVGGNCVDACDGAVCPAGQICQMGQCVADPNANMTGTGGSTGVFGAGVGGNGGAGGAGGAGGVMTGGGATSGGEGGGGESGDKGGCGCRVAGGEEGPYGVMAAGLIAMVAAARRRRR